MQLVNYLLSDAAVEESRGDVRHVKGHDLRGGNGHVSMHFKPDRRFVKVIGCDIAALGALLFGKLSGPVCHPTMPLHLTVFPGRIDAHIEVLRFILLTPVKADVVDPGICKPFLVTELLDEEHLHA